MSHGHGKRSRRVEPDHADPKRCRFFRTSHGCKWGAACRFSHDVPSVHVVAAGGQSSQSSTSASSMSPAAAPAPSSVSSGADGAGAAHIPGFYFDVEKKKYFKLRPGERPPQPPMPSAPQEQCSSQSHSRGRFTCNTLVRRSRDAQSLSARPTLIVGDGAALASKRVDGLYEFAWWPCAEVWTPHDAVLLAYQPKLPMRTQAAVISGFDLDGDDHTNRRSSPSHLSARSLTAHSIDGTLSAVTDIRWCRSQPIEKPVMAVARVGGGGVSGCVEVCSYPGPSSEQQTLTIEMPRVAGRGVKYRSCWTVDWLRGGGSASSCIAGCDSGGLVKINLGPDGQVRTSVWDLGASDVLVARAGAPWCAYIGQRSGSVLVYDTRAPPKQQAYMQLGSAVASIEPTDYGANAVVGSMTGELLLWDTRFSKGPAAVFAGHVNSRTRGLPLSVEHSCGVLAGGGEDGMLRLWNASCGGEPLRTIRVGHDGPVCMATMRARWGRRGRPGVLTAVGDDVKLIECGPAR